jgi:hypothetical protein
MHAKVAIYLFDKALLLLPANRGQAWIDETIKLSLSNGKFDQIKQEMQVFMLQPHNFPTDRIFKSTTTGNRAMRLII